MGLALCPCDGSLAVAAYLPTVELLRSAVDTEPSLLLEPLGQRIATFAEAQRFEEAAWARDRHRAVVRAIQRRRAWLALQRAGRIEAERDGELVVIDGGRLTAAWSGPDVPLLAPPAPGNIDNVASSVLAQEEADAIWKWLTTAGTRLIDVSGDLSLPPCRVEALQSLDLNVVSLGSPDGPT